jgi:hypothetical protein
MVRLLGTKGRQDLEWSGPKARTITTDGLSTLG